MDLITAFLKSNNEAVQAASAILQTLVIAIGALGGLYTFVRKTRDEQRERDRQIFKEVDDIYFRINELLLRHPELDASWYSDGESQILTPEQKLQQDTLFEMITRMFERAHMIYRDSSREDEWKGWEEYIGDYCRKKSFYEWWNKEDWPLRRIEKGGYSQYNTDFETFMNSRMSAAATAPLAAPAAGQ